MNVAHMAACIVIAMLCLHCARAATLLLNTISIDGSNGSYSQQTTLSEVRVLQQAASQPHA